MKSLDLAEIIDDYNFMEKSKPECRHIEKVAGMQLMPAHKLMVEVVKNYNLRGIVFRYLLGEELAPVEGLKVTQAIEATV